MGPCQIIFLISPSSPQKKYRSLHTHTVTLVSQSDRHTHFFFNIYIYIIKAPLNVRLPISLWKCHNIQHRHSKLLQKWSPQIWIKAKDSHPSWVKSTTKGTQARIQIRGKMKIWKDQNQGGMRKKRNRNWQTPTPSCATLNQILKGNMNESQIACNLHGK